jgi:hypothetical protein
MQKIYPKIITMIIENVEFGWHRAHWLISRASRG